MKYSLNSKCTTKWFVMESGLIKKKGEEINDKQTRVEIVAKKECIQIRG